MNKKRKLSIVYQPNIPSNPIAGDVYIWKKHGYYFNGKEWIHLKKDMLTIKIDVNTNEFVVLHDDKEAYRSPSAAKAIQWAIDHAAVVSSADWRHILKKLGFNV